MPLLQNLEELRQFVETDLPDEVLEAYVADADSAIVSRYGANFEELTPPLTMLVAGGSYYLLGIPSGTISAIREGTTTLTLNTHYRVVGLMYQRLPVGTTWASYVEVDYTPEDDTAERKRAIAQLVKLTIEYNGLTLERVGDYSSQSMNYAEERSRILSSLGGMLPVIA